jgi:hypothetical protein
MKITRAICTSLSRDNTYLAMYQQTTIEHRSGTTNALQTTGGTGSFQMFFWDSIVLFVDQAWFELGNSFLSTSKGSQYEGKEGNNITTSFVALSPCKHVKRTCECSKTPDRNQTRPLPQSPQTSPRAKNLISFLISIIFVGKKGFLNLEFCDSPPLSRARFSKIDLPGLLEQKINTKKSIHPYIHIHSIHREKATVDRREDG